MKINHLWHLFLNTATQFPNEVALIAGKDQLTYQQLLQEVFNYADYLHNEGVKTGERVGVLLSRDKRLIVTLLSILANGASYVPLEKRFPVSRNQAILKDSNCSFLVTDSHVVYENVFQLSSVIQQNNVTSTLKNKNFSIDQLAYIIYTSGSTGVPKGVMITHANTASMLCWAATIYGSEDLAYTLAATSICFDLSVFEIFLPLCTGGCVVLVDHALTLLDSEISHPVTLINTVPSAIQALLNANAIPSSTKVINLAGEALHQAIVNDLYDKTQVERVYNLYGPSETTTYSTYYLAEKNSDRIMVPIGFPISGTQIVLLDQNMHPVPKLVRGEVCIAGEGVSLGYCNREEETKERFIDLTINGVNTRLYRTGDLARINHSNELEYLGRLDHQIKIRGFRVEPGEVAHILMRHDAVKQAFVMTHSEVNAGEQLIAYIVLHDASFELGSLKKWLGEQVPDYMLPGHLVQLDALPINNNGKVDRKQLPLPEQSRPANVDKYETDTEQQLADIWKTLWPVSSFSRLDNFFHVGGHSLLAARLQAKISSLFAIDIKLEEIFEYPDIARQAALIDERQQAKSHASSQFTIVERPKEIPLSSSQQRLWYLQYAEEATPISNIPIVVTVHGKLDLKALEDSFKSIISRHEILRTTYESINFHVVQKIHHSFDFSINQIKCDASSLQSLMAQEANKKFDLRADLMIRATLFEVTGEPDRLMVVQHHIASDAWSLNILMHELSLYYKAYHRNSALPVLAKPVQYADYSCWQRLNSQNQYYQDLAFWRGKLENAPDTLKLPYDFARPESQSYRGEFYMFDLDQKQVAQLKALADKNQSTLFMVLLTAFNILLYRYTQQNDFCIGILSANRPHSELEKTLGFFVNTLVARNQVESSISVRNLLRQTRRTVLDCLAHQQLPFDKLVEELRPDRQGNRHPFFQILFSLQNALDSDLELDDLEIEAREFDRQIAKFDLTLSLVEKKDRLSAIFEFNSDLFMRESIARMTTHYQQILSQMIDNSDSLVGDIALLGDAEHKQWLVNFNADNQPLAAHASIGELFAQSVLRFPDKIALIEGKDSYSYTDLDIRANRLANYLMTQGVGLESPVAIVLPRCADVIITMLAVLKAGGCYVPLDTNWPVDRVDFIIKDANIRFIVSKEQYASQLPSNSSLTTILLDESRQLIDTQPVSSPAIKPDACNSCYIMYTSGSTGRPKGVIALHQGVTRLVKNTNYVELNEQHVLLQLSQLVFDGSTFDIWAALLNGGKLILMPNGLPELNKLADLISAHKVTTLFITTQLFNTLVEYKLQALASLKQILFGGDVASVYHVDLFKKAYPDCMLRNIYGPTECTTFALSYLVPNDFDKSRSLPLGQPVSNTCAVILTENNQITPVGVPGEICLGGQGLARGYLNHDELTHNKFIANPFAELNTTRLYRTGDVGCYRADGQIVFLGRVDNQIKLRGYRIELSEIEQALREIEPVIDAVVIIQKPEDLLVAYIIVQPGLTTSYQLVRQQLMSRLPAYMVPDAIEILAEYPLTTNGKIDKEKLPRFQSQHRSVVSDDCDNELAAAIRQIWVDVLDDHEVTYEDNFFEIGGNSLKIVHVFDKLQEHFKGQNAILAKLDITSLFQYPTIVALAKFLQDGEDTKVESELDKSRQISRRDKRKEAR